MHPIRNPLLAALAGSSLILACTGVAHADSIVYAKAGDVYLSAPDGTHERRLTRDATRSRFYTSPSQADDGSIVAVQGHDLVRIDRRGRGVTATFDSITSRGSGLGPYDAHVSPDGTKVAYWVYLTSSTTQGGITYLRPGRNTVWQDARTGDVLGTTLSYSSPSWMPDGRRSLVFFPGAPNDLAIVEVGQDQGTAAQWFGDSDNHVEAQGYHYEIGAGELNRPGDRLAVLRATDDSGSGGSAFGAGNSVVLYRVHDTEQVLSAEAAPVPYPCPITAGAKAAVTSPTFSPDGRTLLYGAPDGVHRTPVGDGCADLADRLVIPGGASPDWGPAAPADVPADARLAAALRRCSAVRSKAKRAACVRAAKRRYG